VNLRQYEDHLRYLGLDPEEIDDLVMQEGDRLYDEERDRELTEKPATN